MRNIAAKVNIAQINWKPDKQSIVPMHKQIYDFIKSKIASGDWSIGNRLPTQVEMANAFKVNRSTVLEAYDELKTEGLIESKKSSGTIIVNNTWSVLASKTPPNWDKYIESGYQKPNLNVIKIINELNMDSKMIRLGAGELSPEMYPVQYMKSIYDHMLTDVHYMGYEEAKGLLPLREEVCKYLKPMGIDVNPNKVLIVSGVLQALHLISMGILRRGSTILTEQATYIQSLTLFESHGIHLTGVAMDGEGLVVDDLLRKVSMKKPELLYTIPSFQNPTGILMSDKRRSAILKLCEKERLPILEDDTYRELWLDEAPAAPIKAGDQDETVLYMGSISKSLSAGMRVGWIVGAERVIDRLADIKMQTDYGSSSISQWMCYEFLAKGYYQSFIQSLRGELKIKRDFTLKILEHYFSDIATWQKPAGGFYIWLTLNKEFQMYRLFESCYRQGVVINPGNIYDITSNKNIRISFSYASLEDIEQGLIILARMIKLNLNKH
ncbi:PLP-dependent aminotransferase family protein [Fusibacter sp. 3D3]|uniref:aminotransferase-like domain-containing protein n=1 Tax=Fusibacter sp. 3D3 TaxID=1048380 RepID=UPI000853A97F|nr:PLP-dependent aminotransferase family protein [Fusibacter sp. 3D3]GAU76686.1 aspartate aminotransferase [Fusibacter sp. 3D3]